MVYVYPLFLVVVSRESVRRWFLKAGEILSRDGVRRRGFIAVDETVTCLGGLIYGLPGK